MAQISHFTELSLCIPHRAPWPKCISEKNSRNSGLGQHAHRTTMHTTLDAARVPHIKYETPRRTRTPLMNTSTPHHTNTRLTDTRTHTPAMCAVCDTPPHPRTLCRDRTRRGSAEDLTSRERTHRHPHDFAAGGMIQYQNSIPRRPRVVACEASGRPPANTYPTASCGLLVLLPTPKVGRSFLRVLGVAILRTPVRAMIAASAPHMPRVRRRAFMGCRRCAAPCSFAPRRATRACWRR